MLCYLFTAAVFHQQQIQKDGDGWVQWLQRHFRPFKWLFRSYCITL